MKIFATRMMLAAAAAGMAFAPVAASAKTRAADSSATYSAPASQPGTGRSKDGSKAKAESVVLGILAAGAVIGGIIAATQDGGTASPGT